MACMPCRCRQPASPSVASMLMARAFIHVYIQIHASHQLGKSVPLFCGTNSFCVCVRGQLGSLVEFQLKPPADDEPGATCNDQPKITGWLSKPTHGLGRGASDRQFVSVNRRRSGDRPLAATAAFMEAQADAWTTRPYHDDSLTLCALPRDAGPCDLPKLTKAINEVYHQYNRHQFPVVALNIEVSPIPLLPHRCPACHYVSVVTDYDGL